MGKESALVRSVELESLKWGVEQRLEFIDFRLFWNGRINRSDVMARFGISPQQASNDLDRYAEIAAGNIEYDRVLKTFVRGRTYKPIFAAGMGERYLMQIQAMQLDYLDRAYTWFEKPPASDVVSLPHAKIEEEVLLAIVDAIRQGLEIEVDYWTLSGKPPGRRRIAPHAVAFSDRRWHARCWNAENGDFRDFNLSRMANPEILTPTSVNSQHDLEWSTIATMKLVPNDSFSDNKKAAVRREHGFKGEVLEVKTRLALLFYYRQEYKLDSAGVPPEQQPLILVNGDELEELRQSARRMSVVALSGGAA